MARRKVSTRHARRLRVGSHQQLNATVKVSTARLAKTTALYRGITMSTFIERAILAAVTKPQEPTPGEIK